jgi:hypothetical protein
LKVRYFASSSGLIATILSQKTKLTGFQRRPREGGDPVNILLIYWYS